MSRGLIGMALCLIALASCAPEVMRRPTQLTPMTESQSTIEILKDVSVLVGPGYTRVISMGSAWTRIGRVSEGEVYKPVNRVFTVEGAHIHEAYLVLEGDRLTGFYLPVERAFSPAREGTNTQLATQRR